MGIKNGADGADGADGASASARVVVVTGASFGGYARAFPADLAATAMLATLGRRR
jgi:hypothetical protein